VTVETDAVASHVYTRSTHTAVRPRLQAQKHSDPVLKTWHKRNIIPTADIFCTDFSQQHRPFYCGFLTFDE